MAAILKYRFILTLTLIGLFNTMLFSKQKELFNSRQRASFIYDFIKQMTWANTDEIEFFNITIMEDDDLYYELNELTRNHKLQGKSIKVSKKILLQNIGEPQVIYVNSIHNYRMSQVLKIIPKKNTLVIGENYSYHKSMINIIDVYSEFFFEMNESKLRRAGFKIPTELKIEAVKSSTKWQELFIGTKKELQKERELVEIKEDRIRRQANILLNQYKSIKKSEKEVEVLKEEILKRYDDLKALEKEYGGRLKKTNDLQEEIALQAERLKKQKEILRELEVEIGIQNKVLSTKELEIVHQKEELGKKGIELKGQRRINLLLSIVVILTLVLTFLLYYAYQLKKKSNVELTKKNKMIEKQNQEIKEFAFLASHDLQEPLNTIIGFADILKRKMDKEKEPKKTEMVELIDQSAFRMRILIRDLLEYSRLGKEKKMTPIDFKAVIEGVKKDLRGRIESKEATININQDTNTHFLGRETEIRLLFQNIISNALKFSRSDVKPIIRIKWELLVSQVGSGNKRYLFTFSDNGIGIKKENRERIFDVFQRLHAAKYEGTGIGLAHCKKIVTNHGGEIWVDDNDLGGLTVFFTLESFLNTI